MHQISRSLEGSYIEIHQGKHTHGRINGNVIDNVIVIGELIRYESDCIE